MFFSELEMFRIKHLPLISVSINQSVATKSADQSNLAQLSRKGKGITRKVRLTRTPINVIKDNQIKTNN